MYFHIFKTLYNVIEQSYEAENNFVVLHSSRKSILQGFTIITHIFSKVIKSQDPLEGEGVGIGPLQKTFPGHTLACRPISESFIFLT